MTDLPIDYTRPEEDNDNADSAGTDVTPDDDQDNQVDLTP